MHTYLLRLEGDRHYVGRSVDLSRRLTKHLEGSAWTRKYPPVSICGVWSGDLESFVYFVIKAASVLMQYEPAIPKLPNY